ncbi:MAG: AAA family ATPase, partial [Desulfobacterales bacterium]|nr:AAA family ATPase [Desulfobacterales bacterium]
MNQTNDVSTKDDQEVVLEGDTYEIVRKRLITHGKELKDRLGNLNQARKDIFGSIESTLLATERITTQNNCMPRDMVPLDGDRFIFGYNVHMGLKTETKLSDVFAIYEYKDHTFTELPPDFLNSGRFEDDFKSLYKYYKGTTFAKFSIIGPHLFMVFRMGKSPSDIKTFKWIIQDGTLSYVDNRSDHEFKLPPQHEFTWTRTKRDAHRSGEHPHVSIEDRLFVEAVGGDITFKVEDNTDTGQGIYAEPVDDPDQTLDDAEIFYAIVGHMILVKVKPYLEKSFRYFIFNEKIQTVSRVDEIDSACVLLPDDQGLIFSNGYYLQSGELKTFESRLTNMMYESHVVSANGEDFLYIFYQQDSGDYILLHYNLIEQKVDIPIPCSGFSCFDNGEMLYFRSEEDPSRHHVIQIFKTPFVGGDYVFSEKSDSFLYKIGNPDIVRCMSECNELFKLLQREEVYSGLYVDLVKKAVDISDSYFWLDREEAFNLKEVVLHVKEAAEGAIDEFEKVVRLKKSTASDVARVSGNVREILGGLSPDGMDSIDLFVKALTRLRGVRGEVISLKELRYIDLKTVETLEEEIKAAAHEMSQQCVTFLLTPVALDPYEHRVNHIHEKVDKLDRVTDGKSLMEEADTASKELEMLIEIVSNLKIEDSTQTTKIIDTISDVYANLNKVKVGLKNKIKSLASVEGVAQFNAQVKLLNQSVINYLDICDTPEKCDEYLTKMMIQIEELEGKFSDFDDFIIQLTEKRDELYNAFETKKLGLVEARNRKAETLMRSAERILKGIATRVASFEEINDINGYFAADLMIEKIRDIVKQLIAIEDTVKADDIQSRLKTIREDTVRQLKDRKELYVDGEQIIKFGEHKFSVNRQPLDLTIVHRESDQVFHLTGTNFFESIDNKEFYTTHPVWDMEVGSEDDKVYRSEYLAFQILKEIETADHEEVSVIKNMLENEEEDALITHVQQFMGPRYAEGYTKGIHDHDGAKIFRNLAKIHFSIGLLRFHPRARALARVFWALYSDKKNRNVIASKLNAFGMMCAVFPGQEKQENYIDELTGLILEFVEKTALFPKGDVSHAGRYLFFELIGKGQEGEDHFVISKAAADLLDGFLHHLKANRFSEKLSSAREDIMSVPKSEFELVRDWVRGYVGTLNDSDMNNYIDEAAAVLFVSGRDPLRQGRLLQKRDKVDIPMIFNIDGMAGDHQVINDGTYHFNYIGFMEKLIHFEEVVLPLFTSYQEMKKELTEKMRETLRLSEFKPRILSSFVRNRLINQVYLPLVGDNLAKQMGVVGEQKRTDLMGLLLLVSPPGYGKTTLMEYLANRLGIIFMKINGPAIGHNVTSLDPAEAPNASAKEEVKKLNLSLEMGDNVMIYLDDIQHCNPEFLQKFISLCDAQRKIEGVYKGRSRTYDLRGKKVVVVMAGNPYTESGEKFKIPDMLANRADTYNLGDIIGDNADVFKMSYLENALTSNSVLNKLSSRSQKDIYGIIRIAETDDREGVAFSGTYSVEDVNEMVSVMKKMSIVRDVILKVNKAYIQSAAQADEYRTEPPFKLQGSYRNMNRITEKIVPIMNDEELTTLVLSHYENEAQTLTTGTESNLLKFKELTGWLNDDEDKRWHEIKKGFKKIQLF